MKTVSRTIKLAMLVLLPAKALPCPAWQADPGTQARPVTSAPQGRSSSQTPQMSPGSTPEPPTTQTQTSVPGPGESPEFTREVNAMIARESQLLRSLQTYVPRMETYIQDVRPDPELGSAPVNDHYCSIPPAEISIAGICQECRGTRRATPTSSNMSPGRSITASSWTQRGS